MLLIHGYNRDALFFSGAQARPRPFSREKLKRVLPQKQVQGTRHESEESGPAPKATAQVQSSVYNRGIMKLSLKIHWIVSLALAAAVASLHAATPDEQAVLAPITALFDGMAKRDAAAMKAPLLPGGTLVLMRDGKPVQMTFESFAERVGRPGTTQIQERIHDPLVRIDNDLAVVWAPFEFLVDGKVDHCGTDLFNLVRTEGKWLIASIADTGRNDCAGKPK